MKKGKDIKSIYFPAPIADDMVRAVLKDGKTAMRIPVKPQPRAVYHDGRIYEEDGESFVMAEDQQGCLVQIVPPYSPGDILYVREAWYNDTHRYMYRSDYRKSEKFYRGGEEIRLKWRPSSHMPKEAARIFLRVTNVRVERLQDITNVEAMSEGIKVFFFGLYDETGYAVNPKSDTFYDSPIGAFANLWDIPIKPKDRAIYGWNANPWVFVTEFKRISKEEAMDSTKEG